MHDLVLRCEAKLSLEGRRREGDPLQEASFEAA
jgi:hypothetical protein